MVWVCIPHIGTCVGASLQCDTWSFRGFASGVIGPLTGLLSNQGEKSINLYFIRVPLRKAVLKYGTPKPS